MFRKYDDDESNQVIVFIGMAMETGTNEENQDDDETRNQKDTTLGTEMGKQWISQETKKVSNIALQFQH